MLVWSIIASPSPGPGSYQVRHPYAPLTGISLPCMYAAAPSYLPYLFLRSDGSGAVSPEGIAYYNRLIDALLAKGQSPSIPAALSQRPMQLSSAIVVQV